MTGQYPPTSVADQVRSGIYGANELVVRRRLLSLREHYEVEDRSGNRLADGEGNFIQIPAIFQVKDASTGLMIMQIEGKVFSLHNQFTFTDDRGAVLGTMRKKIVRLIGDEFWIERDGTDIMRIFGDFLEHDYSMEAGGRTVAQVHRKWVSLESEYGISILGDVDRRLVVGATMVIEHTELLERRTRSQSAH